MKYFLPAVLGLMTCLLLPCQGAGKDRTVPVKPVWHTYTSPQWEGQVGVDERTPLDNPFDNVFHVNIDRPVSGTERVWLIYELDGVEDHTSVSRSINDQLAVGGYLVKARRGWATQREAVSAAWLREGDNVVRFTTPVDPQHSYRIRNVRLEIQSSPEGNAATQVVLNQPSGNYYFAKAYIKGFVTGSGSMGVKVNIAGKAARIFNGEFESIIDFQNAEHSCSVDLEVVHADGTVTCSAVDFTLPQTPDFVYGLNTITHRAEKLFTHDAVQRITLQGASVYAGQGVVKAPSLLSITTLRDVDIPPLDAGMVNVTAYHEGFRFLPHGSAFNDEVAVTIPFDAERIPEGYTAADIRTFYFDEQSHHWVPLKLDTILTSASEVVSATVHFTDMINGIIKVPEAPLVEAFNPTSMKGIKAADPTAALALMEPPRPNSNGNASLGYPLRIPAGRAGVQPQLALSYSSGGGNGWMGLGWNLTIPMVSIETRWGVPRYDETKETETYTLNGEMLTPVAHRSEPVTRAGGDREFYPRVEGAFSKIIRHGNNPSNYWWEVTEKNGTRFFYGGSPTGFNKEAVLRDNEKDDNGNIAQWCLSEIRDVSGNTAKYYYAKVEDKGVAGGTVNGYQIYIDKITYTGFGGSDGKFSVVFLRDRQLGEPKRKDIGITASLGFKQVTADLLRKIEVQYDGSNIRHYELNYGTGEFYKTLLTSISEFDSKGDLFNTHEFEYYNDVRTGSSLTPFTDPVTWNIPADNIDGGLLVSKAGFDDNASAISGNKSTDFGFGMTVTVGFNDGQLVNKSNTLGGSFGYSESETDGRLYMLDINGDGLEDKVMADGNGFRYRANLSASGTPRYSGQVYDIVNASAFFRDKSKTTNAGFEAQGGFGEALTAFVGAGASFTTSVTSVYFTDVNGDQLPDLIEDGVAYFNHLDTVSGTVTFLPSSSQTPSPILNGRSVDPGIYEVDPRELEDAIDANPLHDVVRMWRAPYSGQIAIHAPIALVSTGVQRPNADGVTASIQKNGNPPLWRQTIPAGNFSQYMPSGVSNISVVKGDRIYFRVQSVFNGESDLVQWSPVIEYTGEDPLLTDANAHKLFRYSAEHEFVLSAPMEVATPIPGRIRVESVFEKPQTTDDVRIDIIKRSGGSQTTVFTRTYTWDQTISDPINLDLVVAANESFLFRVTAPTNVAWPALEWRPHLYYTESFDPNVTELFRNGTPVISYYAVPDFSLFANAVSITEPWVVSEDVNEVMVEPVVAFPFAIPNPYNGQLTFSVKKRDTLLLRESLSIQLGQIVSPTSYEVEAREGDTLYFEYHTSDEALAEAMTTHEVSVTEALVASAVDAGLYTRYTHKEDFIFGTLYRQWGHFAYNGNRSRANSPINEGDLRLSDDLEREYNGGDVEDPDDLNSSDPYDPSKDNFIMLFAKGKERVWSGYDEYTFIDGSRISSSRMGDDDLTPAQAVPGGTTGTIRGINKISKSTSVSLSGGAGGGIANGSANVSTGTSRVLSDFMDMNGDRYPDVVTEKGVQFTKPTGELEEGFTDVTTGNITETTTDAFGASAGGFVKIEPKGGTTDVKDVNSDVGGAKVSGIINVNYGQGKNTGTFSWQDINGDGLPDRVYSDGNVQLNLGYKLAPPESWNQSQTQVSESQSFGGGLGFSIGSGSESASLSGGIGLSRSDNEVSRSIQDVNGDGLADEVTLDGGVKVKLNTGNGFSSSILTDWTGAGKISESSTTGESANAAFTGCIPLPPIAPVIKLCFNPSGNVGQSMSRDEAQITDVNGDGFPDFVTSVNDGDLHVKASKIGRTNLLKHVKRPLGATFTLNYERVGNTYAMPNDVWTLASLKVFDGFRGDGADSMLTTYSYDDGRYDRHERDFYGFRNVITRRHDTEKENKPVYTSVIQTYANDNYYEKGLLLRELMLDADGNIFVEKENIYELRHIHTGAPLPEAARKDPAGNAFPALTTSTQKFYEGQSDPGKSTAIAYEYDTKGNVINYTDFGDEGEEDNLNAVITYHYLPDLYILATPQSIIVNGSGVTYRKRETVIDPSSGDITAIKHFLDETTFAAHDLEYDAFGNLKKITKPVNHRGQRLAFDFEYDDEVETYTTRVTNSYGYSSETVFDVRYGEVLHRRDLNGNEIEYELDAVGRIKSIRGPYEKNGANNTIEFEYHPDATVPWALTNHFDPQIPGNKMQTSTFMDGLGRVLQTKKDAALYEGDGKADKEVMIVSGRLLFDAFGRTVKGYFPITEELNNQGEFNPNFDEENPTETAYDVLDRVVSVNLPDGAYTQTEYGFGSDRDGKQQFTKKITDANGKQSEEFTDVRGRITAFRNLVAGEPVWTSFRYNGINEQTEATDDLGNTTTSSYDNFGRRTSRQHPDAGTTTYAYDLAGNLRERVTANLAKEGEAILYNYDFERLTEVIYPENTENNIRYTYGQPEEPDNRAGRVVLQEDASGAQEFSYGPLGEVVKTVRTIVLPKFGEETYVTEWEYDTWNRVVSMTYADGEEVTYAYNAGGLLHSMTGKKKNATYRYVNQLGYDKFEQRVFLAYGNGTKTTFAYEPQRRRLETLTAQTAARRVFMNNHYTFDKVSNILNLRNDAPIPNANLMGGAGEYTYEYDDLYRLQTAAGRYQSKNDEHAYSLLMVYNSVGSITQKTQTHLRKGTVQKKTSFHYDYTYSTEQPHVPVHIGGTLEAESGRGEARTYTYDFNGNQTGWEDDLSGQRRRILWDEENRIRSVYDNGAQHHYAYDAAGERVWKAKSTGQRIFVNGQWKAGSGQMGNYTVYVNPYLVLTSGGYTKHYYIEGQRIVSKLGGGWDNHGKGPLKAGGDKVDYATKAQKVFDGIVKNLKFLGDDGQILTAGKSGKVPPGQVNGTGNITEAFRYFFHPDHLGSTSFVTDAGGEVYQHLEYFPFGETFVEEHSNTHRTPYLFNGKELDDETGLYYYGERYYDPTLSMWLSSDPLSEMIPGWSPYSYAYNNPVTFTDPDGKIPIETIWDIGNVIYDVGKAVYHHVKGEHDKAKSAWGDAALDAGAMMIPYVPAGVSKLRYADDAVDAVKSLDKVSDAKKLSKADDWEGAFKAGKEAVAEWKKAARAKLRRNLGGKVDDALQAHHTIPLEVLEKNPLVRKAAKEGFDINSYGHLLDKTIHAGPHKEYSTYVENVIRDMAKGNPRLSAKDLMETQVVPWLNNLVEYAKRNKISINEAAKRRLSP